MSIRSLFVVYSHYCLLSTCSQPALNQLSTTQSCKTGCENDWQVVTRCTHRWPGVKNIQRLKDDCCKFGRTFSQGSQGSQVFPSWSRWLSCGRDKFSAWREARLCAVRLGFDLDTRYVRARCRQQPHGKGQNLSQKMNTTSSASASKKETYFLRFRYWHLQIYVTYCYLVSCASICIEFLEHCGYCGHVPIKRHQKMSKDVEQIFGNSEVHLNSLRCEGWCLEPCELLRRFWSKKFIDFCIGLEDEDKAAHGCTSRMQLVS